MPKSTPIFTAELQLSSLSNWYLPDMRQHDPTQRPIVNYFVCLFTTVPFPCLPFIYKQFVRSVTRCLPIIVMWMSIFQSILSSLCLPEISTVSFWLEIYVPFFVGFYGQLPCCRHTSSMVSSTTFVEPYHSWLQSHLHL